MPTPQKGCLRNSLLRLILPPREKLLKVIRISRAAEGKYDRETRDLAPVINWALTKQVRPSPLIVARALPTRPRCVTFAH